MMRRSWLGAVLVGLAACGGKDTPDPIKPVAGDLTVAYNGPSQTDGALLVVVTGVITEVKAVGAYQVASASLGPTSTRVVVVGALTAGDIFKIRVSDVNAVTSYTVRVDEAADRATFALNDPSGYSAGVRK